MLNSYKMGNQYLVGTILIPIVSTLRSCSVYKIGFDLNMRFSAYPIKTLTESLSSLQLSLALIAAFLAVLATAVWLNLGSSTRISRKSHTNAVLDSSFSAQPSENACPMELGQAPFPNAVNLNIGQSQCTHWYTLYNYIKTWILQLYLGLASGTQMAGVVKVPVAGLFWLEISNLL